MKPNPKKEQIQRVVRMLESNPEMLGQVELLLGEMEDETMRLTTADEAEDALVERMHEMTREALEGWARKREGKLNAQAPEGARRGGKKN